MEEEVTYAGRTSTGRKPMREILFRGKRIEDKEWVYGTYMAHDRDGHTIFNQNLGDGTLQGFEVIPETVGQYTGLKDKNGVKIFEGDVLHWDSHWGWYVEYENGAFRKIPLEDAQRMNWEHYQLEQEGLDTWEIIGNIHDNPEAKKKIDWMED